MRVYRAARHATLQHLAPVATLRAAAASGRAAATPTASCPPLPQATPQDVDAWVRQGLISDQEAKSFSPTQLDFLVQKRGACGAGGG